MENSSSKHGSSAGASPGCASCCDARQEHGLATCSSAFCGSPKQTHGPAIGRETDSILYRLLTGTGEYNPNEVVQPHAVEPDVEEIQIETGIEERPPSILESLLRGQPVDGYEVIKPAPQRGESILEALLSGRGAPGYPPIVTRPLRRIKPKRPLNVTTFIKTDPKPPPFKTRDEKYGPTPRTAAAAIKVNFRERCEEVWEECEGVRGVASKAWDDRVLHRSPTKQPLTQTTFPKYIQYTTTEREDRSKPLPPAAPVKRSVVTAPPEIAYTDSVAVTPEKHERRSDVSAAEVADLRERAKAIAAKLRTTATPSVPKKKTLEQKIGWRFMKAFKTANKGILWVHKRDKQRQSQEHEDQSTDEEDEDVDEDQGFDE